MHIDLLDPGSFANGHPFEQYTWLQNNAPVYWHDEPNGPGFWAITRYEDVAETGRAPHLYSSEPTIMIDDPEAGLALPGDHQMMLMMDPPAHTQFRRIISREFTRGPAAELKPRIAELAANIIDEVIDQGECEFVNAVAGELPSYVIAELMGIPLEDGRELYKLTEILHSSAESLEDGAQTQAMQRMFSYASHVYRDKHDKPSSDLASQIVHAELEGRSLDEIDFQLFFMLLIDAGGDTTRNLVAGGLYELLRTSENRAALKDWQTHSNAELNASAREELLRRVSPVIYMRRTAKQDTEIHGQKIKQGDKLVRYFGAANHDPLAFDNPHTLDLTRFPNEQIAFGTGTHVCLGQHIARVEIDCMFNAIFERMADFELLQPPQWLSSNFISGIRHMPLGFTKK